MTSAELDRKFVTYTTDPYAICKFASGRMNGVARHRSEPTSSVSSETVLDAPVH